MEKTLNNKIRNEKLKNIKFILTFIIIALLIGFSFLGFLTKSTIEIEGEVISISLVASSEVKNYNRVFFETPLGVKGVFKQPQFTTIKIGDRILCHQTQNYLGMTRYKFIKKL